MPTAVGTSVDALFNVMGFAFPAAGIEGRDPTGVPILIWGGASAVGSAAIQVARAAGFDPVLTTASPKNHDSLKEAGATRVFNYSSPTVVDDIKGAVALTGKKLSVMFDAVSSGLGQLGSEKPEPNNTPDLAKSCASDGVSAEDLILSAVLPVTHDPSWQFCIGIRTYGDKFWLGSEVSQNPSWPIRMKTAMDWVMHNHEKVWKPVLKTTIVQGAERGIEEIRRVADGRASREKVLIAHPM
jgi:threonine dehydrogenase-like Zn-dependent dehydrogenase